MEEDNINYKPSHKPMPSGESEESLSNPTERIAMKNVASDSPCVQGDFNQFYQYMPPRKSNVLRAVGATVRGCHPLRTVYSLFPALKWVPRYRWREDAIGDLVSGVTVAIMHIPQGMAYAQLGGVAPVVGIYMAFFPVLLYVMMGTSRHISMGTFAVVCMMSSKSVMLYSEPSASADGLDSGLSLLGNATQMAHSVYTPLQVATAVCFTVGIWQIVLGVCRLGVLSVLLSETLVSGFTTGAAVHVVASQLKHLFGVPVQRFSGPLKVVHTIVDLFGNLASCNPVAVGISAATITVLVIYNEVIKPRLCSKLRVPVPVELLAVIAGTLVSMLADLQAKYNISVVGDIPTGLPPAASPPLELVPLLLVDGLVIAIVAFSVNMSMASIFSRKLNYPIDANQELIASGSSNVFGSFFACLPFAASLSRSMIQQSVGGRTQLASVVSCLLLLLVLLLIGPFFEPLPNCILASIVVVALKSMFMQMGQVARLWRHSAMDGAVWVATFLGVVLLDIDYGLAVGLALSLGCLVTLGQRPALARLGRVADTALYLDLARYRTARQVEGVFVLQVAGGLHFANCQPTQHKLYQMIGRSPTPSPPPYQADSSVVVDPATLALKPAQHDASCVVLDMSVVPFVDPSAMKTLLFMYHDLATKGTMLCLAACTVTVYERLSECDFFLDFPRSQAFACVHSAVLYAQAGRLPPA